MGGGGGDALVVMVSGWMRAPTVEGLDASRGDSGMR
jgi:hypothetical protein